MSRKDTKVVHIGDRVIGGGNPILIQSMCNTKTEDVKATVAQILSLEKAGCDIIVNDIVRIRRQNSFISNEQTAKPNAQYHRAGNPHFPKKALFLFSSTHGYALLYKAQTAAWAGNSLSCNPG